MSWGKFYISALFILYRHLEDDMKKRAVGYCRISTLMQVDNTSLKDQEDIIRMYAKLHDIVIDKMFIDMIIVYTIY